MTNLVSHYSKILYIFLNAIYVSEYIIYHLFYKRVRARGVEEVDDQRQGRGAGSEAFF